MSNYGKTQLLRPLIKNIKRNILPSLKQFLDEHPELGIEDVSSLNLMARTYTYMEKNDIKTIGELINLDIKEYAQYTGIGKKCLLDMVDKIQSFVKGYHGEEKSDQLIDEYRHMSLRDIVEETLSSLSEREQFIIKARYGLWDGSGKTLEEIGGIYKLTRERIRQIEAKVLRKLKHPINANKIRAYLNIIFNNKLLPYINEQNGICVAEDAIELLSNNTERYFAAKEEYEIAGVFISDIYYSGAPFFTKDLIGIEEGVYAINNSVKILFELVVNSIVGHLRKLGRPLKIGVLIEQLFNGVVKNDENASKTIWKIILTTNRLLKDNQNNVGLIDWDFFQPKTITGLIYKTLLEIGEPTHYSQITMLLNERYPELGPYESRNINIKMQLYKDIFVWVSPGVYGLKIWGLKRPPEIKGLLVSILSDLKRPLSLEYLKEKALKKCNCKEASVQMTLDLQKDVFTRGKDGLYGLKIWE